MQPHLVLAARSQDPPNRPRRLIPSLLRHQQQQHLPPVGIVETFSNLPQDDLEIVLVSRTLVNRPTAQILLKRLVGKSVTILPLFVQQTRPIAHQTHQPFRLCLSLVPFQPLESLNLFDRLRNQLLLIYQRTPFALPHAALGMHPRSQNLHQLPHVIQIQMPQHPMAADFLVSIPRS